MTQAVAWVLRSFTKVQRRERRRSRAAGKAIGVWGQQARVVLIASEDSGHRLTGRLFNARTI